MTRDVLNAILRAASGLTETKGTFRVEAEHRVSFYLGNDSDGMVVHEVTEVQLAEAFVAITAREPGILYCAYDAVRGVSVRAPKENAKKAGFL